MSGTLVLCGAPIGDPRDASPRLAEVLATADVIAAEDTRRLRRLAHALGITIRGRVVSCYDAVEGARAAMLTEQLLAGSTVALITDAGMPAVSDPGFRLVAAASQAGVPVTVVPGPSAVTAALAVSGLPSDRWTFEGFLPRKGGERRSRLRGLAAEPRTMVFLESPHRLVAALREAADVLGGGRRATLCRELTKTWEEIVRTDLAGLVDWATDGREIRGEFTLVVEGGPSRAGSQDPAGAGAAADLAAEVAALTGSGMLPKDARKTVAGRHSLSPRQVYAAVLAARDADQATDAPGGYADVSRDDQAAECGSAGPHDQ
ncbi:16S rRNA (cytidine(1402)-2'-O)-methyltransferase [Frankia sp. Cpl3]|nr:16S rRNA (cytidine(1402)-2'-O)-methyltransferase [Frankia sp. Cpl3]